MCAMTSRGFSVSGETVVMTTEMHSAGEPLRIVEAGDGGCRLYIEGQTLLEKRRYIRKHLDALRKFLMWEPRGHHDMYGALLVEPDHPGDQPCVKVSRLKVIYSFLRETCRKATKCYVLLYGITVLPATRHR